MNEDFYCLKYWNPEELNKESWVDRLKILFNFVDAITRTADFRYPQDHVTGGLSSAATYWHQDLNGEDVWMIIWANIHPTKVRKNNTELSLKEKHIYMFKNMNYEHMLPLEALNTERYFAKCHLKDVSL
jgi:hypothetical protein